MTFEPQLGQGVDLQGKDTHPYPSAYGQQTHNVAKVRNGGGRKGEERKDRKPETEMLTS